MNICSYIIVFLEVKLCNIKFKHFFIKNYNYVMNASDYIKWRGDLSFGTDPFNEIDGLIFAYISYLDIAEFVDKEGTKLSKVAREYMAKYNVNVPLWVTETNYAHVGKLDDYTQDNEIAANYLVRMLALNEAQGDAQKVFFYDFKNDGINTSNAEHNFGLIEAGIGNDDTPYSAKPGYLAMCNYNSIMSDSEYAETISDTDSARVFKYNTSDGGVVYVGWSQNGSGSFSVNEPTAKLIDLFGNESSKEAVDGVVSVQLGSEPVYLKVGGFSGATVSITDAEGNELNSLDGLCEGDFILYSSDAQNGIIICAMYDGDRLVSCDRFDSNTGFSEVGANIDKIKVFMFNDLESLNPVARAKVLE